MNQKAIDLQDLTEKFFSAMSDHEWSRALEMLHPDAVARQNISGSDVDAKELLQSMRMLVESMQGFAYENVRRVIGERAVVEQHDVRMTRRDGQDVVLDVCVVLRFNQAGQIVRLDEYLDSRGAQALFIE